MQPQDNLNRVFSAFSDPTRRAMLTRLGHGETISISELARPFEMSLPAVMKHLAVLETAGLIVREKTGRTVHCRLNPDPIQDAMSWLEETRKFWEQRLDSLADFVEADEARGKSKTRRSRKEK